MSADENNLGVVAPLTEERVLELIESSYPNPVTVTELAKCNGWQEEDVQLYLVQLQNKGLAKPLEHGAFTRAVAEEVQVRTYIEIGLVCKFIIKIQMLIKFHCLYL